MCKRCKERSAKLNQKALTVIETHRAELMEVFRAVHEESAQAMEEPMTAKDMADPITRATNDIRFASYLIGYMIGLLDDDRHGNAIVGLSMFDASITAGQITQGARRYDKEQARAGRS